MTTQFKSRIETLFQDEAEFRHYREDPYGADAPFVEFNLVGRALDLHISLSQLTKLATLLGTTDIVVTGWRHGYSEHSEGTPVIAVTAENVKF